MPIGEARKGGASLKSGNVVYPASVRGTWTIANDDAKVAQSASDLLNPQAIDDAQVHWVEVHPGATRAIVRAIIDDSSTFTTSPVLRLYGAYGTVNSDGGFTAGTRFMRLDNADVNAAGFTLTLEATPSSTLLNDGTNAFSDPQSLTGYDLCGAWYIAVVVSTAAVVGASVVPIEVLLLN